MRHRDAQQGNKQLVPWVQRICEKVGKQHSGGLLLTIRHPAGHPAGSRLLLGMAVLDRSCCSASSPRTD